MTSSLKTPHRPITALFEKPCAVEIAVAIMGIVILGVMTALITRPEFYQPDSSTYLSWSPLRTPGYPALLSALHSFDADLRTLPFLQMASLIASTAIALGACNRLRPAPVIWIAAGLVVFINPYLWRFAWMVMPESIFISLCVLFVAAFASAMRTGNVAKLAVAGLLLAAAILFRPVAYPLMIAGTLATLLWFPRRWRATANFLTPVVAILLVASAWNWSTRGVFSPQSMGGFTLVGAVAFLIEPQRGSPQEAAAAKISERLKPVADQLPQRPQGWADYAWFISEGYNRALFDVILPILQEQNAAGTGAESTPSASMVRINEIADAIARRAISEKPLAYAWHVTRIFAALWTIPVIHTRSHAERVAQQLCAPEMQGFYCPTGTIAPVDVKVPSVVAAGKNALFGIILVLSLVVIAIALITRRPSPLLALMALTALCINGHHGVVAMFNSPLPRYTLAMWPLLCIFAGGALLLTSDAITRLRKKATN